MISGFSSPFPSVSIPAAISTKNFFVASWDTIFLEYIAADTQISAQLYADIEALFVDGHLPGQVDSDGAIVSAHLSQDEIVQVIRARVTNLFSWVLRAQLGKDVPSDLNKISILKYIVESFDSLDLNNQKITNSELCLVCEVLETSEKIHYVNLSHNSMIGKPLV